MITIDTVFESGRNTVANRLASSGEEWTSLFAKFNNGCYNNQVKKKRESNGTAQN